MEGYRTGRPLTPRTEENNEKCVLVGGDVRYEPYQGYKAQDEGHGTAPSAVRC